MGKVRANMGVGVRTRNQNCTKINQNMCQTSRLKSSRRRGRSAYRPTRRRPLPPLDPTPEGVDPAPRTRRCQQFPPRLPPHTPSPDPSSEEEEEEAKMRRMEEEETDGRGGERGEEDTEEEETDGRGGERGEEEAEEEKQRESYEHRRKRFLRTAESGLLDVTMKTAELLRRNQDIQKEIESLQEETRDFVASVLTNPENRPLLDSIRSQEQLYEIVVPGSHGIMAVGPPSSSSSPAPSPTPAPSPFSIILPLTPSPSSSSSPSPFSSSSSLESCSEDS